MSDKQDRCRKSNIRYALQIEYAGSGFHGFQLQPASHGVTVQGELERCLARIIDQPTRISCAGRTDTGVHATSQWVHFDSPQPRPLRAFTRGLNAMLANGIAVIAAQAVEATFHARFSATERRYIYLLADGLNATAIVRDQILALRDTLDVARMQIGAGYLVGRHDFSSFRAAGCQAASPVRCIREISIRRIGGLIALEIAADGFLQHMVRNIVGALLPVGRGECQPERLADLLRLCDRRLAPPTAKAEGLYLVSVSYPDEFGLDCAPRPPPLLLAARR